MLRVNRHFVWSVLLILVVIINLLNVNVVLADDDVPPPPATEEPVEPPTETPLPEATLVSVEETHVSEDQASLVKEAEVLEVLQELPDNAEIVVLDENGDVLPLGSQDAVE